MQYKGDTQKIRLGRGGEEGRGEEGRMEKGGPNHSNLALRFLQPPKQRQEALRM